MSNDPKRNPIILEIRSNKSPQQRNEDEYGPLSLDLYGRLRLLISGIEDGVIPGDALEAVMSLPVGSFLEAFNGGTWDRVLNSLPADAQAALKGLVTTAQGMGYNGGTWDRLACNALGSYNAIGLQGTQVVNALIGVVSSGNHVPLSGSGLGGDPTIGGTGMLGMAIPVHASKSGKYIRQRCLDTFKTGKFTAAGSSVLWTPAAGASFRLMRIQVDVTGGVTAAAAADLDIVCYDGATAMPVALSAYIPAAVTGNSWSSGWIELDNGILSAAADNALSINLSFALTAGVVRVSVAGTEE